MMFHTANDTQYGFTVREIRESSELRGRTVLLEHGKTGAKVFWVDNGAENMVFSIAFRTLPQDSTGVFHIIEHSVLCGSRKYPVKEPFVELLKSSMNTFLNALTFWDMTMYPVASRNPRDLLNLTDVYLDAVFDPEVIRDRKRFLQEGWRIDREPDGTPVYKGVVLNEMKGSMSDTDTLIEQQISSQLFPDTSYGFNSGGDPARITDLTYEQFCEQYRLYYHPSNALIYLDGNVPMDEMLPLISSYLDRFERREDFPAFRMQEPTGSERTIRYELGEDETAENKSHLTLARLTGTWEDRADNMARGIICDVLTGSNEAPLKRKVLERELAQDLAISIDDTSLQSWITIHAENVTDGREAEIIGLLQETGREILRDGLDRHSVEASLNRAIYALREEEEPQGIGRCIRCTGSWLYGGDPTEALENAGMIRQVREYLDNGRFNELAADMLLNTDHLCILHTLPSRTLGEEKRKAESDKLQRILAGQTEAEKKETEKRIAELEEWQNTPDSPEQLKTLPRLKKEDANIEPEWVDTKVRTISGVPVLFHQLNCNGVIHFRAYFALTDYSLEELTRLSQLAGLMGRLPTEKHDALNLQLEIKRWTGMLGFAIITRAEKGQEAICTPYLAAFCSALEDYADKALELMTEILTSTRFEDRDKMIAVFRQNEMAVRQRVLSAGHLIAAKNVMSHFSAEGAVKNALDGDVAARYIRQLAREPEKELPGLFRLAERMKRDTICRKRLTFSVTSTEPYDPEKMIGALPDGTPAPAEKRYAWESPYAAGYRIPAQTGFAVRGYHLSRTGKTFEGCMWLAASILTLGYLWNRIRVQGGAYGAGLQIDRTGNIFSYSYRDPTPGKTLEADAGASAFLKQFAAQDEELDSYIISALNELNPLLSARDKGALADGRYMTNYTREEAERIRRQILYTVPEDLVRCAEWLDAFSREGAVCVVAHKEALDSCDNLTISDL